MAVGSVLFAAVSLTQAASIVLHQDAVSAAVAHRLFVDNGKRMLAGSLATCAFAYAEQPTVTFRGGRVFLRMHLSGRAAVSVNGACMGPGDSFNATVSGQPYIEGDRIAVRDVRMDEGKKEYRGMVEPLVRSQLPALLGSNLRAEFGRYLDSNIADLRLTVTQFQLQEVVVNDGTLTVRFDFALQGLRR
ncbi:MAG: hypothetical protein ABIS68_10690 [Casimicrobiaceae bacterium]